MPIIPTIQQQRPTADAAAPVLDRQQRPTVDTGEVQGRLARVNEANKMPLMDPQAMAAPWDAIAGLGEVIQKTGSVLAAAAYKDREALGIKQYGDVRARWIAEQADFEKWKETRPPEEWEPESVRRFTRFQEGLKDAKLTNEARLNVDNFLTLEGASFQAKVGESARKSIRMGAAAVMLADIEDSIQNQKADEFKAKVSKAKEGWYIDAFKVQELQQRYNDVGSATARLNSDTALAQGKLDEAKAAIIASPMPEAQKKNELANIEFRHGQKQEFDAIKAMSFENPEMAAELAAEKEKAGKLTPLMRIELQERAKFNRASMVREAVADYKGRIQLGERIDADMLDNDPRLNEEGKTAVARMADGIQNMPADFERALVQAMSYDPATFGSEMQAITEATNLEASFEAAFDGARLQSLKAELDKRRRGSDIATAATDIGPALKLLDEWVSDGGLNDVVGPVERRKIDQATGRPMMRDPQEKQIEVPSTKSKSWFQPYIRVPSTKVEKQKENNGQPVPITEADPVALEKAAAIQREIRLTLAAEVKTGKLKDQEQISTRAFELFALKGGKVKPEVKENSDNAGPNPLLPPVNWQQKQKEIINFIDTYGS